MRKVSGKRGGTLNHLEKGDVLPGAGRPKGLQNSKTRLKILLEILTDKKNPLTGKPLTAAEMIDFALFKKAAGGDVTAYREIMDRVEGKVIQKSEIDIGQKTVKFIDVSKQNLIEPGE